MGPVNIVVPYTDREVAGYKVVTDPADHSFRKVIHEEALL